MSPNFVLSLIGHIIAFRRISKCTKTPYPACPMRLYEPCTISRESAGGGLCSVPLPDMHIWLQQKGKMHLGVQSRKPFPLFFLFPRSADRTVRSGGGSTTDPITERVSGRVFADSLLNGLGKGITPILAYLPFCLLRSSLPTFRFLITLLVIVEGDSDVQLIFRLCFHHHFGGLGTHDVYQGDHHSPVIHIFQVDYLRMG